MAESPLPGRHEFFQQYRVCLELSDSWSRNRELFTHVHFLAHCALSALFVPWALGSPDPIGLVAATLALVAGASVWNVTLTQLQTLSRAKFKVIELMEDRLACRPLVKGEWSLMEKDGYVPLSRLQRLLPWIFSCLYAALLVRALVLPLL